MRSDLVVIGGILLEHATQLRFVAHDRVVEGFAANRAEAPVRRKIIRVATRAPRRSCVRGMVKPGTPGRRAEGLLLRSAL